MNLMALAIPSANQDAVVVTAKFVINISVIALKDIIIQIMLIMRNAGLIVQDLTASNMELTCMIATAIRLKDGG